jgi:methanol metabolism-related c-type cytochrome
VALVAVAALSVGLARADKPGDPAAVKNEDGKYFDKDGNPTFKIGADGTVDWYTYSGYRRYHSECHVCHGPDGEGSTYAPGLKDSVKNASYAEFLEVVVNGRQKVGASQQQVMPAFGLNSNVMCYLDDIYVYLRARGHDALGRVRPAKREAKPAAFDKAETICLGQQ